MTGTSRRRGALAAAVAVSLTGGCALVADLSQFDNATTSADAGAPDSSIASDVGSTDSSVATTDDGVDVPVQDGGEDSAADANHAADAGDASKADASKADASPTDSGGAGDGSTRYCVQNAGATSLYCDDFDDGRTLANGFGGGSGRLGDGGALAESQVGTIESTTFFSPPSALLIATDTVPSGGYANYQLVNHLASHTTINLLFSLMIPDLDPGLGDLSLVRIADNSGQWGLSWDLNGGGGAIQEVIAAADGGAPAYLSHGSVPAPPSGTWVTVNMEVVLSATNSVLSMTSSLGDGGAAVSVLSNEPISPSATVVGGGSLSVTVGVNYLGGPAVPMHIYYDDVQVLGN